METAVLEALFLPWWKIVLYIGALAVAIITIRFTISFNINFWLESRRAAKAIKERRKRARSCRHFWTLYHSSQYSRCNRCAAFIATTTLLAFESDPLVLIAGDNWGDRINPGQRSILVEDPRGVVR